MRITPDLTDAAVLQCLGARLERRRIDANLTQAALATRAGVSKRTLERIEAGQGCELVSLVRLLRVLNLVAGLEGLIPDLPPSPIEQLERRGRERRRVRAAAPKAAPARTWEWGE